MSLYSTYVESLPAGLDSYPACQSKASALMMLLDRAPERAIEALPPPMAALAAAPPPVSAWVPEVHLNAMSHALCDAFPNEAAYLGWAREGMNEVLGGPMYRIALALAHPAQLVKGGRRRWAALRKGTQRELIAMYRNGSRGRITAPTNLYDELHARILAESFEVVLKLSRAADPIVEVVEWSPESVVTQARWDRSERLGEELE